MLKTVLDTLHDASNEVRELLAELLLKHSALHQWNQDDPSSPSLIISTRGDHAYKELSEEGRFVQARLLEKYRRFNEIIRCLLRDQPKDTMESLESSNAILKHTIEQQDTWCKTTAEALKEATNALLSQIELLKCLYDPSKGEPCYVPDTNALLHYPKLESWNFPVVPKFTVVLLPTVLSELDAIKGNHRNKVVRQKAEKLIRQIKEYRRRGKLTEGVNVVTGAIKLLAIATEPGSRSFLPWFDPYTNDDRILAATLEVMRRRPRSPVILVTRDINLQNKAEFARIPFVEPPEPK